ncbi:hypothetical protein [Paenibacillus macquariensis]|uniref:hypothetical protein n=1 Tax=Paenibacillus macquariensis TaxID=948756 RepID=UPI0011158D3D|nr:hypothetical protein [Paenibacillus macquariensis]MEC0094306.1 hypothetical protein [Paenibacillus macquariensis]
MMKIIIFKNIMLRNLFPVAIKNDERSKVGFWPELVAFDPIPAAAASHHRQQAIHRPNLSRLKSIPRNPHMPRTVQNDRFALLDLEKQPPYLYIPEIN